MFEVRILKRFHNGHVLLYLVHNYSKTVAINFVLINIFRTVSRERADNWIIGSLVTAVFSVTILIVIVQVKFSTIHSHQTGLLGIVKLQHKVLS